LVAFVEERLVGQGFSVKRGEKVFDKDGTQAAEFDVVVEGKVGSTEIRWLIECRDRPSSGSADGQWIDSLYGRRERFGFNKVTAVSTSGFAPSAFAAADRYGIELRTVESLTPDAFKDWLPMMHITNLSNNVELTGVNIELDNKDPEVQKAVLEALAVTNSDAPIFRRNNTGELVSPGAAFLGAVGTAKLFDKVKPDGVKIPIQLRAIFRDDDYLTLNGPNGPERVLSILFVGTLRSIEQAIPIAVKGEYRNAAGNAAIAQFARFAPALQQNGMALELEFHRIAGSAPTFTVRKVDP